MKEIEVLNRNMAAFLDGQKDVKSVCYKYSRKSGAQDKFSCFNDWSIRAFDKFSGFNDRWKPTRKYGDSSYDGTFVSGSFGSAGLGEFLKERGYDPKTDYATAGFWTRPLPKKPKYDRDETFVEAFAKGVVSQTGCTLGAGRKFVQWLFGRGFGLSVRAGDGIDLYHEEAPDYVNDVRYLFGKFSSGEEWDAEEARG